MALWSESGKAGTGIPSSWGAVSQPMHLTPFPQPIHDGCPVIARCKNQASEFACFDAAEGEVTSQVGHTSILCHNLGARHASQARQIQPGALQMLQVSQNLLCAPSMLSCLPTRWARGSACSRSSCSSRTSMRAGASS